MHHRGARLVTLAEALSIAEEEEQDVVGPDAIEHHDQDHLARGNRLEVEGLVGGTDQTRGDHRHDRHHHDRHHTDDYDEDRTEEHTSDTQSIMRIDSTVIHIKKKHNRIMST